MMSIPGTQDTHANGPRLCRSAAFLLCAVHALSVGAVACLEFARGELNLMSYEAILINFGILVSPILLILIVMRLCLLVFILAVPVLVIFAALIFHFWSLYARGDIFYHRMGDWGDFSGWIMVLFGAASLAVVAIWLAVWLVVGAAQALSNLSRTSKEK